MNFGKYLVPIGGAALLFGAWRSYGWPGVALVSGGIVMFLLLHLNRTIQVLRRAADRPIGTVASAVMLNARLKPRATLLHVVAMTRGLGELRTPKATQPEIYRWTDAGGSYVEAEFRGGKLTTWTLTRPDSADSADDAPPAGGESDVS